MIRQATSALRQIRYSINSGIVGVVRNGINTNPSLRGFMYILFNSLFLSLFLYSAAIHANVPTGFADLDTDTEFVARTRHPIPARVVYVLYITTRNELKLQN
ncbi:hypothetical protein Zmor_010767 [Zophobas morio]|uniref:Uncharacterized protein n=1 Tax=Zophobas morio TaxID=2755281 RepID=A0AA38IP95_9CUCU|nr:hypothetical protein Zmor_010767 [Zophobas morio]